MPTRCQKVLTHSPTHLLTHLLTHSLTHSDICKSCVTCITAIRKLMKPDGFPYCELFREVPDKRLYPDYYVLIPQPISLKEITAKLKKRQYMSVDDVIADFTLMATNAKVYNSDASTIYKVTTHSLTYLLTHLLTHSPTHSLTHLLTHSPTHSLTCPAGRRVHEGILRKLLVE